jgi:hypothetical protein
MKCNGIEGSKASFILDSTALHRGYLLSSCNFFGANSICLIFLSEYILSSDSVTNRNGTFGWGVYNDGVNTVTGSIGASVYTYATLGSSPPSLPVPGAVWLFGSGLMGWLGFLRRKPSLSQAV